VKNFPITKDNGQQRIPSRRSFFGLVGGAAAVGALAACGDTGGSTNAGASSSTSTTKASGSSGTTASSAGATTTTKAPNGDLDTAMFAASLEVLAVGTYGAALDAAGAGKLGAVPPAVAEFVTKAKADHQAALDKWNGVIKAGGKTAVTEPPKKLKATVDAEFAKVKDVTGAAELALLLEETASATYLKAIPTLKDKAAIELAGGLQVVDAQHVSVLLFVLGRYPVPEVFAGTDKAAAPG